MDCWSLGRFQGFRKLCVGDVAGQTRRDTHTQAHDDDVSLISHNFETPKICRGDAVRVRVSVRVTDICLFAHSALFSPRGSAFSVGLGG